MRNISNLDLVGIYSSGYIYTGLANSLGQFNWHSDYSFSFDYSIYNENNNAIKLNYSSKNWNNDEFDSILNQGKEKLDVLSKPIKNIEKGEYNVYLEPSALNEIIDMMSWEVLAIKQIRSEQVHYTYLINQKNPFTHLYQLMRILKMEFLLISILMVLLNPM